MSRQSRKVCSDVIARTRCVKSPNPLWRYFRQIERQEVDFRTNWALCFLNHTPGEHRGGCVSGGIHEITSTWQPPVVHRTKGLFYQEQPKESGWPNIEVGNVESMKQYVRFNNM